MPRVVLFDLDGTLVDSAPDLAGAGNDMRLQRGLPALPYEALRPMVGSGARGMVGAARTDDPNSANSQFFITFDAAPWLDGQYTIWGEVVSGMEFVDKIKRGEPPANPDKIVKMQLAADAAPQASSNSGQ